MITSLLFSAKVHTISHLLGTREALSLTSHVKSLSLIARNRRELPENRSAERYKLHLPVIFHWNDGGDLTEGGFTYDVALDGALICSSTCPPIGREVRIEVLVPSPDQNSEQLRIQCVGKVTRGVSEGDRASFGVKGFFDDEHIIRQIFI